MDFRGSPGAVDTLILSPTDKNKRTNIYLDLTRTKLLRRQSTVVSSANSVTSLAAHQVNFTICTVNKRRFLKFDSKNILDDYIRLLFCFQTIGVRRFIDVLHPDNQPGSGKILSRSESRALWLTEDV